MTISGYLVNCQHEIIIQFTDKYDNFKLSHSVYMINDVASACSYNSIY